VSAHPVLELQARIGNRAVAAWLHVQRQPEDAAKAAPQASPKTDDEVVVEAQTIVTDKVVASAGPIVGTDAALRLTTVIRPQFVKTKPSTKAPKHRATDPFGPLYDVLYGAEVVGALRDIVAHAKTKPKKGTKKESRRDPARAKRTKLALFIGIINRLLPSAEVGGKIEAPATALDEKHEIEIEEGLISQRIKRNCEGGWGAARVAVLSEFGALQVGPRTAIERANDYFASLDSSKLWGREGALVHPELQNRLDLANSYLLSREPKMTADDKAAIARAVSKMGGFNIRGNRNAPYKLSDHSFGWALDFLAAENPNIGTRAGLAAVRGVTGRNPFGHETEGKNAADVEATATTLADISSDYVNAMESRGTLGPRLLQLVNDARSAAQLKALAATTTDAILDAAIATYAKNEIQETAILAVIAPEASDHPPTALRELTGTLASIGGAFRTSFDPKSKTGRVKAKTEGTPGSIAAHGFVNLSPLLVSALAGTDTGGLNWLGTSSVHDYMHFQLPDSARPTLY
jgi:hypothetical protein